MKTLCNWGNFFSLQNSIQFSQQWPFNQLQFSAAAISFNFTLFQVWPLEILPPLSCFTDCLLVACAPLSCLAPERELKQITTGHNLGMTTCVLMLKRTPVVDFKSWTSEKWRLPLFWRSWNAAAASTCHPPTSPPAPLLPPHRLLHSPQTLSSWISALPSPQPGLPLPPLQPPLLRECLLPSQPDWRLSLADADAPSPCRPGGYIPILKMIPHLRLPRCPTISRMDLSSSWWGESSQYLVISIRLELPWYWDLHSVHSILSDTCMRNSTKNKGSLCGCQNRFSFKIENNFLSGITQINSILWPFSQNLVILGTINGQAQGRKNFCLFLLMSS